MPQVCQYNIPVSAEYSHSCQNITTGQECTVECSEGWTGGQAVLSCGANGILSGALPTCSTATTTATTTTFWDGTVRLSGSLSLRLEQRRRLQAVQTELSVVQDFVEDGNVTAGGICQFQTAIGRISLQEGLNFMRSCKVKQMG